MRPQTEPAHSTLKRAADACRVCRGTLETIIEFGPMPLANAFLKAEDFEREYFFDLAAGVCTRCYMFQLLKQPEPAQMFHEHYPFFTGSSVRMTEHFRHFAETVQARFLKPGSFIVEIGSNDGTFLEPLHRAGHRCLGVEPSANTAARAISKGIRTHLDFFSPGTAKQILGESGHANLITAANCLCHIPEPQNVFEGLNILLHESGVAVFEDPYWGDVMERTAYDQIYDEHVFLFSVSSMTSMAGRFGFEVFDLEPQWTHGGSMRYYLSRKGNKSISPKVTEWLTREKSQGFTTLKPYHGFRERCEISAEKLILCLENFKHQSQPVAGYAATSKSTTVLNYCGVGPDLISFISDTTPEKQGKYTPGTHIPVVSFETFQKTPPKAAVLFAWNHADEILKKESDFQAKGGQWIHYIPDVRVE